MQRRQGMLFAGVLGILLTPSALSALPADNDQTRNAGDAQGVFLYCGDPAEDVDVYIPGRSFHAITGPSGEYRLSYVPAGTYNVVFAKDGHRLYVASGVEVRRHTVTTISTPADLCLDLDGDGVTGDLDCNDTDSRISPDEAERCFDGLDNNCDGRTDEGCPECVDADGDGYYPQLGCDTPLDCDDSASAVHPGANEVCDGIDNNCDGQVDEADAGNALTFYRDGDGDGFGADGDSVQACAPPDGYVTTGGDCDDGRSYTYPGARELCNGIDDDCDGVVDNDCSNQSCTPEEIALITDCENQCGADQGCLSSCLTSSGTAISGECLVAGVNLYQCTADNDCSADPDPEQCSYINCTDEWIAVFGDVPPVVCTDGTTRACGTDVGACQSGIQTCVNGLWDVCEGEVGPVAEVCNGVDDDCDGSVDDNPTDGELYYLDGDGDGWGGEERMRACAPPNGYVTAYPDCDDSNSSVYPNAPEVCNGIDDDCDGLVDEGFDLGTDPNNCGACGNVCDSERTCMSGYCMATAPQPINAFCVYDSECISSFCDPSTLHCSLCIDDSQCPSGRTCTYGYCMATTPQPTGAICQLDQECVSSYCDLNSATCASCTADTDCSSGYCDPTGTCTEPPPALCTNGATRSCGIGVGACQAGTETCADGIWGPCLGATGPAAEVCNEIDDDCDGLVDEDFDLYADPNNCGTCGQVCPSGVCAGGSCLPAAPQPNGFFCIYHSECITGYCNPQTSTCAYCQDGSQCPSGSCFAGVCL